MEHLPVTLTEFDKLILEEYCDLAEGLGAYLGSCYELVVHSFASFDHSVIKIVNNHSAACRKCRKRIAQKSASDRKKRRNTEPKGKRCKYKY